MGLYFPILCPLFAITYKSKDRDVKIDLQNMDYIQLEQQCLTLSPFATCGDNQFQCGDRSITKSSFLYKERFYLLVYFNQYFTNMAKTAHITDRPLTVLQRSDKSTVWSGKYPCFIYTFVDLYKRNHLKNCNNRATATKQQQQQQQ